MKFVSLGSTVSAPASTCVVIDKVAGSFFVTGFICNAGVCTTELCDVPVDDVDVALRRASEWARRHNLSEVHTRFFEAASETAVGAPYANTLRRA